MATLTLDQLRKTNVPNPALLAALEARPFPKFPLEAIEERHTRAKYLASLRHLMPVPGPIPEDVTETEIFVSARDGYQIPVTHYKPTKQSPPGPLIVLYHEGGWRIGDRTDEEFNARAFSQSLGATCLNVDYRLAPEHPFPTGINDAWDVLQYVAANAASLHADPSKGFIVGGSSAGGNFSAVLAHLSRNEGLNPPVTGQWLSVPYLIPTKEHCPDKYKDMYISTSENIHDPIIIGPIDGSVSPIRANVIKQDPQSPLVSVVAKELYPPTESNQAGKGPLAKAYLQIAGLDPLRDHALVYERMLREEYGVETRFDLYWGYGHMFWTNWPEMMESKHYHEDMLNGMRWLLDMKSDA